MSHGAALLCTMLSQSDTTPNVSITDIQELPIVMRWNLELTNFSEMEVFKPNDQIPSNRIITLNRRLPFGVELFYIGDYLPIFDEVWEKFIGKLKFLQTIYSDSFTHFECI